MNGFPKLRTGMQRGPDIRKSLAARTRKKPIIGMPRGMNAGLAPPRAIPTGLPGGAGGFNKVSNI